MGVLEESVGPAGDDGAVEERLAVAQLGEADLGLQVVLELLHVEILGRHDLDVGSDDVGRRLLLGPRRLSARFSVIALIAFLLLISSLSPMQFQSAICSHHIRTAKAFRMNAEINVWNFPTSFKQIFPATDDVRLPAHFRETC